MDNDNRRLSDGQMVATGLLVAAPMMLFAAWWSLATLPLAVMTELVGRAKGERR